MELHNADYGKSKKMIMSTGIAHTCAKFKVLQSVVGKLVR